jgi:hypothetical protein
VAVILPAKEVRLCETWALGWGCSESVDVWMVVMVFGYVSGGDRRELGWTIVPLSLCCPGFLRKHAWQVLHTNMLNTGPELHVNGAQSCTLLATRLCNQLRYHLEEEADFLHSLF